MIGSLATNQATDDYGFDIDENGQAHTRKGFPRNKFTRKQRSAYQRVNRDYYRKHKPRATQIKWQQDIAESSAIDADPAIKRYYIHLRNRASNRGYLSKSSERGTHRAAKTFLKFLNKPITNTAISELIAEKKRQSPTDYTMEDKLEEFANPPSEGIISLIARRNYAATILGIFKANRAKLEATSNTHYQVEPTKPISEGILKELLSKLDQRSQDIILLQAYAGQRIRALSTIPLDQIDTTTNELYALFNIDFKQNKSRQTHFSIIPKYLATRIINRAKELHNDTPFPNHEQLWKDITNFAYEYYGIRLTSHYLRKRFSTIASDTPMDVNQWDFLMGSKKNKGHDASIYNLTFTEKIIKNYHTYLVQQLALDQDTSEQSATPETTTHNSLIQQLQATIERQNAIIAKFISPN